MAMDKIHYIMDKGYGVMLTTHAKHIGEWSFLWGRDSMFSIVQIFEIEDDYDPSYLDSARKIDIHNFKGTNLEEALDRAIKFIDDEEKEQKEIDDEAEQDLYAED